MFKIDLASCKFPTLLLMSLYNTISNNEIQATGALWAKVTMGKCWPLVRPCNTIFIFVRTEFDNGAVSYGENLG